MTTKQGCSCGKLVLSGSNVSAYGATMTNKTGKSELVPVCGELWSRIKKIGFPLQTMENHWRNLERGKTYSDFSFWCYWSKSQNGKTRSRKSTRVGNYCEMIDKTWFGQGPWNWRESRWWVWGTYWGNSNSTNSVNSQNLLRMW